MKIVRKFIEEITLEEFADRHSLTMEIFERDSKTLRSLRHLSDNDRFYCHFKNVEIKGDGVLISAFGNGATEEEALEDYRKQISENKLVIFAASSNRNEILVPRLIKETTERGEG